MIDIDWDELRSIAAQAATRAYVPYSNYRVGAAALTTTGRIVDGCNVENASYGITLCAECGLVSDLIRGGGGKLVAFTCVTLDVPAPASDPHPTPGPGHVIVPCGRCRQLLREHADPQLLIETPAGVVNFDAILPQSFGPEWLKGAN